jgi:hypothetical protein
MTKTCNGCGTDSKAPANIPFVAHEKEMERKDRTEKRLWIIIIMLIVLLVGTNGAWIWYESQFEAVEETLTQEVVQDAEDGGSNSFVGGDSYGETDY